MAARTENCENLGSKRRGGGEVVIDRITSLPEHLLLHIMSLLPTKDAVKTSVLSKSWQFLWTSVSTLNFSFPETTDPSGCQFAQSIDKTLTLNSSPKITKFTIDVPYEDALKPQVDNWVRFAVSRHVEVLKLRFQNTNQIYLLPFFLYNNPTLTELSIINCRLHLPAAGVHFPSLKILFAYSPLTEHSVGELLPGCPSLQSLILCPIAGIENLKLSSTNMSSLVIVNLKFSYLWLRRMRGSFPPHGEQLTRFKELLQQLKNVEQLTFHAFGGTPKQSCDIIILDEAKVFWRSQKKEFFNCLQCTLKRVRFIGFSPNKVGWEFVGPLVEFFLNNALMLEKLLIY